MKNIFYKLILAAILTGGLVVGMVRGQQAKQRWLSKMKFKYEDKKYHHKTQHVNRPLLALDEIELASWHS